LIPAIRVGVGGARPPPASGRVVGALGSAGDDPRHPTRVPNGSVGAAATSHPDGVGGWEKGRGGALLLADAR
jgi:hypothetical protein